MNNNSVKCPICNKYVTISGINAHLDSNCQFNIVQIDGTVKNIVNDRNNISNNNFYSNSVEKKKTVQATLFSQLSSKKRNNDDTLNKNISNHPEKKAKIEEKISSPKFDINKKYNIKFNNNDNNNNNQVNQIKRDNKKQLPLAELVRPTNLDDYFGQEDLMGENSILKTLIKENKIPSLIFWGPPGVGKTCLARIIAHQNNTFFREISGTIHSLSDLKKSSEECANQLKLTGKKAILFIDEIHRFNKLQQDSLLSWVERGSFILIGATTENPSFKLNSALLSRCRVFQLKKLSKNAIMSIIERAAKIKLELYNKTLIIKNYEESESKSEKNINIKDNNTSSSITTNFRTSKELPENENNIYIDKEALELLAIMSDGDARNSLNIVDMALNLILSDKNKKEITKEMIKMSFQKTQLLYDKDGEEHNNLISAFHESIRGSDADATLYWLGRMVYAGEDPLYIARRLIRIASEDVGYADNYALTLAISCYQACQFIGMPACDIVLAHTSVYMARAKKSVEVFKALSMVKEVMQNEINYPVPMHLRNAPTELMKNLGYGVGNLYVPDYEEPVEQEYLPKDLKCRKYLGVFEENRRKAYEEKKRLEQEKKNENNIINNDNSITTSDSS